MLVVRHAPTENGPKATPTSALAGTIAVLLALAPLFGGCGGSKATMQQREPTLAEQLAGSGRSVSEDVRGLIVTLPDILFDFDQATIRPEVESTLSQLAEVLIQHPDLTIQIEGHTDSVGNEDYNQGLSERRAQAVFDAFVGLGLDTAHLAATGYGESRPVADNETEEGRGQNRRVELVLPDVPAEQPVP